MEGTAATVITLTARYPIADLSLSPLLFLLRPLNHRRRRRPIFRRHRRRPREEERLRSAKIEIGYPLDPQLCFFHGSRKVTCFIAHSEMLECL